MVADPQRTRKLIRRSTDAPADWIQNTTPFFRIQVPAAKDEYDQVVARYSDTPVRIVTTGHSLGGGLALHISFTHPGIDAIVFNSSPVAKPGLDVQEGNTRVSIWESGEWLQGPRNAVSFARGWDVERFEFRFLHGTALEQHGMERLALNFTKLGAKQSESLAAFLDTQCY